MWEGGLTVDEPVRVRVYLAEELAEEPEADDTDPQGRHDDGGSDRGRRILGPGAEVGAEDAEEGGELVEMPESVGALAVRDVGQKVDEEKVVELGDVGLGVGATAWRQLGLVGHLVGVVHLGPLEILARPALDLDQVDVPQRKDRQRLE